MSELRQDLISGDWVIIAPGRATRPQFLDAKREPRKPSPKSTCPFEHPQKTGNWPPIFAYPNEKNWKVIVIPNKYPALSEHDKTCSTLFHNGIYSARTGIGEHYLIVTRDHSKRFAELSAASGAEIFEIFQNLCADAAEDPCTIYAVPFMNWGMTAGASVWHPHYQFLSLPIIPAHSARSLRGAQAFHSKNRRCAHCEILRFERKEKVRVIMENEHAIAIAPYASKFQFEMRVIPKKHHAFFYKTPAAEMRVVAALTQKLLNHVKKSLNDPDLNLFIHEAPLDGKKHDYHHWHVEIIPRVSVPAGFELSTGIYINTVEPEKAASIIKGK